MNTDIEEYVKSLDDALVAYMGGNGKPFAAHCKRYAVPLSRNPYVNKASVMKVITSRTTLPADMRRKAKKWLLEHNLESWDDRDI